MLKTLHKKHQYFFHLLVVLLFLTAVRMVDSFVWAPPEMNYTRKILLNFLFEFISLLPFIFIIMLGYRWAIVRKQKFLLWFMIFVFTVSIPTLVLYLAKWMAVKCGLPVQNPVTLEIIGKYTPGMSLVVLFLTATYFLTHLVVQAGKQRETAHKAETLAKDVQLKMLRYQINPHFLFNVLNSIYTLIDDNTEKAKKLVIDMSEYYRYTLNKQQMTVTVEKEVESVLKYLEIQKTRFEEEFEYEISVEETSKSVSIPSFIIHLLIENAVKYGTKTMKQKLIIRLSVVLANNKLVISVSNTGKLLNPAPSSDKNNNGTSNGIDNLKNRLGLYYDENYSFSLIEDEGWVCATIEIENPNKI
ncbi:MAG: histidine kinase [Bacteroidales bacterium]|nr:histidine kinase [Bacteroidales bacterium]